MLLINNKKYAYKEAKDKYLKSDTSLLGGVFRVRFLESSKSIQEVNSPIKKSKKEEVELSRKSDCIKLQETLKAKGYYKGKIDGKCGNNTSIAESNFKKDEDLERKIDSLEQKGWVRRKPEFKNINSVKFKSNVIKDYINELLTKKLQTKEMQFQLSSKKDVVLYRSIVKVEDINKQIKMINENIAANENITDVSFGTDEILPSYPLEVNGEVIAFYNYKENLESKDVINQLDSDSIDTLKSNN
jgi:hypothetical protein